MAEDESTGDESPGVVRRAYRTVTPGYGSRSDAEMNSVGLVLLLLFVVILVPLLPFLVAVWTVTKLLDYLARRRTGE